MMADGLASIGECMLELSGPEGADGAWRLGHAGDTFNTLWALRALLPEARCDYVSAFGDDPFSTAQVAFMTEARIGVAASPRIKGARPGLYAITLTGAERSFTYWRSDAAARRLADDPEALRHSLEGRDLIYFSGITLAILTPDARRTLLNAVAERRASGSVIAFDPNYRPRLWASPDEARDAIAAALEVTSIALPTFPDEAILVGDTDPAATADRLLRAGVSEVVVKDGDLPALVVAEDRRTPVPSLRVEAVDTTGAGDSFNGGYLAARLSGQDPVTACAAAHRVAAAVVQVKGALAPMDTLRAGFVG